MVGPNEAAVAGSIATSPIGSAVSVPSSVTPSSVPPSRLRNLSASVPPLSVPARSSVPPLSVPPSASAVTRSSVAPSASVTSNAAAVLAALSMVTA